MLLVDVSRARPSGWTVILSSPPDSARVALVQVRTWRRTVQVQSSYRPGVVAYDVVGRVIARLVELAVTDPHAALVEVEVAVSRVLEVQDA